MKSVYILIGWCLFCYHKSTLGKPHSTCKCITHELSWIEMVCGNVLKTRRNSVLKKYNSNHVWIGNIEGTGEMIDMRFEISLGLSKMQKRNVLWDVNRCILKVFLCYCSLPASSPLEVGLLCNKTWGTPGHCVNWDLHACFCELHFFFFIAAAQIKMWTLSTCIQWGKHLISHHFWHPKILFKRQIEHFFLFFGWT